MIKKMQMYAMQHSKGIFFLVCCVALLLSCLVALWGTRVLAISESCCARFGGVYSHHLDIAFGDPECLSCRNAWELRGVLEEEYECIPSSESYDVCIRENILTDSRWVSAWSKCQEECYRGVPQVGDWYTCPEGYWMIRSHKIHNEPWPGNYCCFPIPFR